MVSHFIPIHAAGGDFATDPIIAKTKPGSLPSSERGRVLVLYFSQTGDSAEVARLFAEPLAQRGFFVHVECLKPRQDYPFPWRSPIRFFDVLPECLLGPPPDMQPVSFEITEKFDLIILVYQVWFLSPSLPVQGFLASPAASVLKDRPVVTVSVSRNMWQSASERMKRLLRQAGAHHIDNVVVTHQGPPWATFITTPRALLFGKTEPFWGVFPAAGLGVREFDRVNAIATTLAERWDRRRGRVAASCLQNIGAIQINDRYLIPEAIGWYLFMGWAYILKGLGFAGRWLRILGLCGFMVFLVCIVGVGIPLITLLTWLVQPFIRPAINAYARHLAAPSGTAIAAVAGPAIGTTGSYDE